MKKPVSYFFEVIFFAKEYTDSHRRFLCYSVYSVASFLFRNSVIKNSFFLMRNIRQ